MKYEVKSTNKGWVIIKRSTGGVVETFTEAFYAHMACAVLND